ncbi:MAG: DUF5915 domain-containing protein, partial [Bacteroidota bacterium]
NVIKELDKAAIVELIKNNAYELEVDGEKVIISNEDVEIISHEIEGWLVETEEGVTVAVDTELNDVLIAEGYARELVNRVQNMRKDAGFDVIDRIKVLVSGEEKLISFVNQFNDYIANEVLADQISFDEKDDSYSQEFKIGDYNCTITILKS